jgi:hypothetical protein
MMNRRLAWSAVFAFLAATAVAGCQSLHNYRTVVVEARDAETKQPLAGAELHLSYPLASSSFAPRESLGSTGRDGVVRLEAAPYGDTGVLVDVTLPGYMSERKSYGIDAIQAIKPVGFFESADKRTVNFVVEMFAEPFPGVELVLPDGYRGTVKATVKVRDDITCPPGQRLFSYVVPPSGIVEVTGPSLLRRVFGPDFHARYANGTVLKRQPEEGDVGFWNLKSEGEHEYFVVGTRAEYDMLRRADLREGNSEGRSSGGKGGGGGGRGRRGRNNTSSDTSSTSSISP